MLSSIHFRMRQHSEGAVKLISRWFGPYEVVERHSDVSYSIQSIPAGTQPPQRVHVEKLKEYIPSDDALFPQREQRNHPEPELVDGEEEWEIDAIVGKRYNRRRRCTEYLSCAMGWL